MNYHSLAFSFFFWQHWLRALAVINSAQMDCDSHYSSQLNTQGLGIHCNGYRPLLAAPCQKAAAVVH